MKHLWRNFALGMLLGMPGAIYANVSPYNTSSPYPACCMSCSKAPTCTACKQDCTNQCPSGSAAQENCYSACDSHAPGYPCKDASN
ncbi:MAG TPA: hypothetical protein VKV18_13525 [Chthonomonas sp.]|nr:hypothetical protein [Chthonomonas sp.]